MSFIKDYGSLPWYVILVTGCERSCVTAFPSNPTYIHSKWIHWLKSTSPRLDCLCQIFRYVQCLPLFFYSPLMLNTGIIFKFKHWTTQMTSLPEGFAYFKNMSKGDDKWHNEEKYKYMMLNTISRDRPKHSHNSQTFPELIIISY